MRKILILALLAALATPSFAQTSIKGIALSDADAARVQRQCDVLRAKENRSIASEAPEPPEPGVILSDPAAYWAEGADAMDQTFSRVNLGSLTLRDCREAGFY